MKKITIIAALAALAFTACEKNGQTPVSGTSEVRFVMDEVVTRVTTASNVTTFDEDDQIAITSEGLYEDIANEKYTYKSTGLDGKSVLFQETGEASFVAHYPSSLNNEDGSIEMTVPAVQTADNFHDNMFMVATAKGSATDNVVTLQFAHQLAWVKVVLEGIDGTAVTLHGVKPTVTWTSSALEASGNGTDITTWKQTTGQEYWALVPAQTIYASTKLITVETATTAYEYTLASELTLTTAKVKTITLSLDPSTGLTQASFSVDSVNDIEWTDDTALEDFVTEKPYVPVVILDGTETISLPQAAATSIDAGQAGWNYVVPNDESSVTVENNAITQSIGTFSTETPKQYWNNGGVFYKLSEEQITALNTVESDWCVLNFTYVADKQFRVVMYPDGRTTDSVDHILYSSTTESSSSKAKYVTAATQGTTSTIYVKITEDVSSLNIFIGGAADSEVTISNVSFKEYIEITE